MKNLEFRLLGGSVVAAQSAGSATPRPYILRSKRREGKDALNVTGDGGTEVYYQVWKLWLYHW